ncbi:hypothetical protein TSUD_359170 [Trifolium subterraneum]|uniref:SAC domain-containing protein n=1 Tax=Trifolium subterraneum TaxID=3900 RepID=A0A2Z6N5B2_TRISU|nr:hypothetical protein TSUD_359170 [Trifolium subterraneum]
MDLTKDFFYSYSYNIMLSLQKNLSGHNYTEQSLYETLFVWNEFLTRGIRNNLQNTSWTVALVYGFFKQVRLSTSGREFDFILIARRSRHYAGTRYLKRGVNERGRVANDVETEQIVFADACDRSPMQISSVTREKKPRETILRTEFANAVKVINQDLSRDERLRFLHWDLHRHSRRSKATNVLGQLGKVASFALNLTGIFYCPVTPNMTQEGLFPYSYSENNNVFDESVMEQESINKFNVDKEIEVGNCSGDDKIKDYSVKPKMHQKGVLRTNCIDCLDRTNVAQYAYGLVALGHQLQALGYIESLRIDLDNPLAKEVMTAYESMGDTLAFQYGGSAAHNKDQYYESDHICYEEHGDACDCSNFLDVDWLSSSGNSCEEELLERS